MKTKDLYTVVLILAAMILASSLVSFLIIQKNQRVKTPLTQEQTIDPRYVAFLIKANQKAFAMISTSVTGGKRLMKKAASFIDPSRIYINLEKQELTIIENNKAIYTCPVSSGDDRIHPERATPTGFFRIFRHGVKDKSQKYSRLAKKPVYLLNHLAFALSPQKTTVEIHALEGNGYERLLGNKASHGCVRVSHKDSKFIYAWALAQLKANGRYPQVIVY